MNYITLNLTGIYWAMHKFASSILYLSIGLLISSHSSFTFASTLSSVTYALTEQCKQASGKDTITSFQLYGDERAIPFVLRNARLPQMSSISIGPSLNATLFEFEGKSIIHCNEPHIIPTFMLVESGIANSLFMLDEFAVVRVHIHSHVNCGTACYYAQVDTIAFPADDWEVRGYQEIKSPTYEYPSKWFRGYLNEAEQELFDKAMAEG